MKTTSIFSAFLLIMLISGCKRESATVGLAKEMCSCLFVSNKDIDYCEYVTREARIMSRYFVNENAKSVTALGLGHEALAELDLERPHMGCVLKAVEERDIQGISETERKKAYRKILTEIVKGGQLGP